MSYLCHWRLLNHSLSQTPHLEAVVQALSGQCARELQSGPTCRSPSCIFHKCDFPSLLNENQGGWGGGSQWLLFLSKKGHAWGFSCCAPGLLCLLFYTQMVLSEGHIWLKYTSVFGLVSTNLAWAVFFKTELRHKNETPGFSWKIRILSTLSPCSC